MLSIDYIYQETWEIMRETVLLNALLTNNEELIR